MSKNHAGFMKRALLTMLAGIFSSAAMPLDIYQGPLVAERSLDPNVLYIHDDSGSMAWSHMPGAIEASPEASNDPLSTRHRSNFINRQYYNPDVTYQPPLKYENGRLISWGNIIGQRKCSWPRIPANGFVGTPNSCDSAANRDEAAADRDTAKREANLVFIAEFGNFFKNEEGGIVFDARKTYDETCETSKWTPANVGTNATTRTRRTSWQRTLTNGSVITNMPTIVETTGVTPPSTATISNSSGPGFYQAD